MKDNLLISIFVPVYNGATYLQKTLTSIKQQTYTNLEILLVDDSSADGSLQILNQFAREDPRFQVFVKENGGMVAHSMNFIIPKITGDYFFYCSQDDLFSLDLIEKMVQVQNLTLADSILPDMEFYFENKSNNKQIIGLNGNKKKELTGKEACIYSLNWSIHGFALFKSSLIKTEFFPEDAFDSDEYVTRKLFLKSNKVVFSDGVFYYRQDNVQAITKTFSNKNFFVLNTSWRLFELLKENNFDDKVIYENQIALLRTYLHLYGISQNYDFNTETDKVEVTTFLVNFKKAHLSNAFLFHNLRYALLQVKWKFILLIGLVKIPLLFWLYQTYKR
jgi:glycosyltransferase involved in cell wall biosynthesis